jgi:hypothetical protein
METRVFGGSERRTPPPDGDADALTLRVARGGAMAVRRGREVAAGAGAAIVLSGADVGPAAPEVIALRLPRPLLRSLVRSRRRRVAAAAAQHAGATAARALSRIPARRQGAGRSGAPARGGRACLRLALALEGLPDAVPEQHGAGWWKMLGLEQSLGSVTYRDGRQARALARISSRISLRRSSSFSS